MSTRAQAQARIDQMHAFKRELAQLSVEGALVLSEAQRQGVDQHHAALQAELATLFDVDPTAQAKQLSWGMRIASFLGALSLAASVFFFFYKFWGQMPTGTQVAILLAAPILSFGATMWLRPRDATGYFTKLAAMVSLACFVLNLTMLGRIFNITPSDKALAAWGAFGLILAYACQARLLLSLGLASLVAFTAARIGSWGGLPWLSLGERPENFLPAAAALLLVPRLIEHRRFDGFAATYRLAGLLTLYGTVLCLSLWGSGSYLRVDPNLVEVGYQLAGFALASLAIRWGIRQGWTEVVNTSVVFFVVLLCTRFFDWWWTIMPKYLFFLAIGLTAVLCLVVLRRLRAASPARHAKEVM